MGIVASSREQHYKLIMTKGHLYDVSDPVTSVQHLPTIPDLRVIGHSQLLKTNGNDVVDYRQIFHIILPGYNHALVQSVPI